MIFIVDTSVWVALFKDKSGRVKRLIEAEVQSAAIVMAPPVRLEVLQGCRGEAEWRSMIIRVNAFDQLPLSAPTWDGAARIYYELRQGGKTIRSSLDCLIAQLSIENDCTLLHSDADFDAIATIRPLKHIRLDLDTPAP